MYSAQKQNILQTVHQKCVKCTEREHFRDGVSEMWNVHRNKNNSRPYTRNFYCAQKEIFPDGTSEMCTVHRNRTFSKYYHYKLSIYYHSCFVIKNRDYFMVNSEIRNINTRTNRTCINQYPTCQRTRSEHTILGSRCSKVCLIK